LIKLKKIEQRLRPDLLRIRNNVTIKELNFTDDKIDAVKRTAGFGKKYWIGIQILGVSACCLCGKIPDIELNENVGDDDQKIIKVEFYCRQCIEKVFSKEAEPQDAFYGCVKVNSLPRSYNEP
jgi:hypothetical protein